MLEGCQRIDVSSAAGSFTWSTNGATKSLVLSSHDADRTELLEAFRDLGNGVCAGKVSRHVACLWAISRAVLVDKSSRFARTAAQATAAKAGEYLSPLQLGTGVSGGVEIAARMTCLAPQAGDSDTPITLLSLDQKNAHLTPTEGTTSSRASRMACRSYFDSSLPFTASVRISAQALVNCSGTVTPVSTR